MIRRHPPIRCCDAAGFVGDLPRVRCQHRPPNRRQRDGRVTAHHQLSSVAAAQGGLTPYHPPPTGRLAVRRRGASVSLSAIDRPFLGDTHEPTITESP
jgi:hypothetical protein